MFSKKNQGDVINYIRKIIFSKIFVNKPSVLISPVHMLKPKSSNNLIFKF